MLGLRYFVIFWCAYLLILPHAEADDVSCPTTSWSTWTPCSTSCGIGSRRRTREISGTPTNKECIRWTQLVDTVQCQDMTGCSSEQRNQICSEKFEIGHCLASFHVWTYKADKGICEEAIYGGCNGNSNRFNTKEECMNSCQSVRDKSVCSLEYDRGMCNANFQVWAYDTKSKSCIEKVYGGCQGNGNRFQTAEECRKTCA